MKLKKSNIKKLCKLKKYNINLLLKRLKLLIEY